MKKYYDILKTNYIFKDCDDIAISHILDCLEGHIKTFCRNEIIYNFYDEIKYAGLVLSGEVSSIMTNTSDNELFMQHFESGAIFATAYSCVENEVSDIQVIASADCSVLFLNLSNLFSEAAVKCQYASKATANLLQESSKNNIFQIRKIQILSEKHIRERLILYLSGLLKRMPGAKSPCEIELPFNRQALANYIGVERSALSREMCKMRDEGLIEFNRNKITIKF